MRTAFVVGMAVEAWASRITGLVMATKKECDRCGKQWELDKREETCAVAIDIPARKWDRYRPNEQETKVAKTYELCQDCARIAHKVLETKDDIGQSAGRNAS